MEAQEVDLKALDLLAAALVRRVIELGSLRLCATVDTTVDGEPWRFYVEIKGCPKERSE